MLRAVVFIIIFEIQCVYAYALLHIEFQIIQTQLLHLTGHLWSLNAPRMV